ncbi:MAG: serine/threonine protein kinase [Deltaproteobacteria bacterium]|nr:serine/threonine protein kinase [Deltaproteobacteria bacterium]
MLAVGNRVGDYQIVDRLRAGGMATLFLARRTGASGFSKPVVIKVIHPHLASDDAFVRMFVDEALLSARIQHPNVVHVEELRQVDGQHLLVMEYVPGCSLAHLLRTLAEQGRRMTPELAVLIAIRVAEGLHAAHETRGADGQLLGVVHRDVTPQNILLAYQGHVKLIDFGIARARGRNMETSTGSLKGKIRYMSPEQAFGRTVDRRADVYSLALVLWEMLAMRKTFDGDNDLALLDRVRNPGSPTPPSVHCPGIPEALDRAIGAAMQPEPEARTPTALAFRRALADALPRALALDDTHLADLLAALLPTQMAEERERASESASGVRGARGAPAAAEEVIGTLTLAQAELLDAKTEISDASGAGPSTAPSSTREPTARTRAVAAEPASSATHDEGDAFSPRTPQRVLLVGLAALALVGLGAGVAWTAMQWGRADPPPAQPTARPDRVHVAPVAAPSPTPAAATSDAGDTPAAEPGATSPATNRRAARSTSRRSTTPRAQSLPSRPRPRPTPSKSRPSRVPLADQFGD